MTFDRGDVVIIEYPFGDLSGSKIRPALVLSRAAYNRGGSLIACLITSNLTESAHSCLLDREDLLDGKLAKPSRVKCDRLFTASTAIVKRRVARVKPDLVERVKRELFSIL